MTVQEKEKLRKDVKIPQRFLSAEAQKIYEEAFLIGWANVRDGEWGYTLSQARQEQGILLVNLRTEFVTGYLDGIEDAIFSYQKDMKEKAMIVAMEGGKRLKTQKAMNIAYNT